MTLVIPTCRGPAAFERSYQPGDILGLGESMTNGLLSTAGAGTWTGPLIATGLIRRTGPVAGFTDTTDTSTNIINALIGNSAAGPGYVGISFRMRFINTVAQALTFAAGTGVVVGLGTLNVAASLWRDYLWTILNSSPQVIVACNTTNASAVVTFALPTGQSSLPIGPNPLSVNITPGMTVSGTGITAGTTVLGVTQGVGGIIGVTLSANATATSTVGSPPALTFMPTVLVDSIGSGTA